MREALFSMLTSDGVFDLEARAEIRVLDLYAGSGALGFEALSRGASSVVFVENARAAIQIIRENAQALDVNDQVTVLAMRVDKALDALGSADATLNARSTTRTFDLVLIDPPYDDVKTPEFAEALSKAARLLAASGILVLEHSSDDEPLILGHTLDRRRRHGDTTLSLFLRDSDVPSTPENEDTHG